MLIYNINKNLSFQTLDNKRAKSVMIKIITQIKTIGDWSCPKCGKKGGTHTVVERYLHDKLVECTETISCQAHRFNEGKEWFCPKCHKRGGWFEFVEKKSGDKLVQEESVLCHNSECNYRQLL